MIKALSFAAVMAAVTAMAQVSSSPDIIDPSRADVRALNQSGSLVAIRLEPKRPISFYVLGREEAKIDLSKLKLTIKRLSPEQEQILHFRREGNRFIVTDPLNLEKPNDLEVTAKTQKKTETFHFKISNVPR